MKSVRLLLICLPVVLVGCVSTAPYHLPPVEESSLPGKELPRTETPLPDEETAPTEQPPATVAPQPSSAVTSLINQARGQYNARNYQVAIATAERGLRIDRRSPELYLILAQSYLQLAMPQQAEQFTQQGLRYAPSGSGIAEALLRVKAILSGGQF